MRDPRLNPEPGDILRFCDRERHVTDVREAWYQSGLGCKAVLYRDVRKCGDVGGLRCSLASWRKWAKRETVRVVQAA